MNKVKAYSAYLQSTIVIFAMTLQTGYSQGTDFIAGTRHGFYLGFSVGPSKTTIVNTGSGTIADLVSSGKSSFLGSVDAGYFFSKHLGISTGIGYSSYVTELSLDTYLNSFDTVDSESETYERRISGNNITEEQKISLITIPLNIIVQVPFGKLIGFYMQTGMNFSFPVNMNYSSTGTYTFSGYYSAYNVLFTDIPYEGFKSNVRSDVSGTLEIKSMIPDFTSSAGLQFLIQKKMQFSIGVFYNRLLGDISDYPESASFRLSSNEDQVRSMMEGSSKVSASAFGLKVSVRYFLQ